MRVRGEKHQYSTFYCVVQTEHQLTKVFVAFVKIFVVEIELKLVALVVSAENRCKDLTFPDKVFPDQLYFEV